MTGMNCYLSILILNINRLNSSIKDTDNRAHLLPTIGTYHLQRYMKIEIDKMEKDIPG